ncbi:MAG: family 1 glycosylhydrolase, partial [Spirochaetota bacterium]
MSEIRFPADFKWGTATAAYQIEGYPLADGASPSIWHQFSHTPGKIRNNENGDIACDHYHRYEEDLENIKKLGLNAYRYSISWPRIVPEPGKVNQKGLDFYRRLTDLLLEKGITPLITLFHWDTPAWLQEKGGFAKRTVIDHIHFYSEVLFREFGDRVKNWVTINEPFVYAVDGYVLGDMPPGHKNDLKNMFRVSHFLLLSHANIVKSFRNEVKNGKIGIAQAQIWITPFRPNNENDQKAAEVMDSIINRLYLDPLIFGRYPKSIEKRITRFLPKGYEYDLTSMAEPFD